MDATALADTRLVFVPVGTVDRVLDEDPSMARIMLASMAKRLQSKVQDIAMLSLQSATQRIVAFVVGDAVADDLIDYVAQQLSVHKRPREVRLVESLPRNAMGKVMKKELL